MTDDVGFNIQNHKWFNHEMEAEILYQCRPSGQNHAALAHRSSSIIGCTAW